MAKKTKQDLAKAKAAKQKKIAIGGGVLLVALLAIQGPKTMKMLNQKPAPPLNAVAAPTTTTPTVTPADPNSLAAPTLGGSGVATPTDTTASADLVDAVPVSADPGQIAQFQKFASKDPFAAQANADGSPAGGSKSSSSSKSGSTGSSSSGQSTVAPAAPTTPSAPSSSGSSTSSTPAPTSAIISLNGELMSVATGTDFPVAGATFNRAGSVFHLVSLTAKTAKIAIAGGSYADGAPAVTLHIGTPLTLQNTADGTRYTLILEPPTTQIPTTTTPGTSGATTTTPTSTNAVVSGSGG